MKANEVPERVYIHKSQYWGLITNEHNITKNGVEYIRTDAFIDKAEKWLNEHILDYVYAKEWGQGVGVEGELFDDFKKAQKGE